MLIQSWTEVLVNALNQMWMRVITYVPNLLGAAVVLVVGLIVASGLATLAEKFTSLLKIDPLLARLGVNKYFDRAGLRLNSAGFVGRLVYWFLVIAFLLAASDILGLNAFSQFLSDVLLYIPNIAVAVLIMLAAVVVGNFLRGVVRSAVSGAKLHGSQFLGSLTWWSVVVFGLFTALLQLGIAIQLLQTLITGFIAMTALAGGIAFGLGGKDYANELLGKLKRETQNHS